MNKSQTLKIRIDNLNLLKSNKTPIKAMNYQKYNKKKADI